MVRERPLLVSDEKSRAIRLRGATETRRVVVPQPNDHYGYLQGDDPWMAKAAKKNLLMVRMADDFALLCPYGAPGDHLWLKESWAVAREFDQLAPRDLPAAAREHIWYCADGPLPEWCGRKRNGRFMPRWASRTTVELVERRVELVQEITEAGAKAEGVTPWTMGAGHNKQSLHLAAFPDLWDSLNASRGYPWDSNPWVWVLVFRLLAGGD